MREILFRGKTYDGEWVEGFLFNSQLCRIFWATAFKKEEDNIFYCEGKDVNPKTVGQFTGLTDRNGKKIFEGDIVNIKPYADIYTEGNFEVCFDRGTFSVKFSKKRTAILCMYERQRVEVIGNVYDNKELLGEGNE